MTTSTTSGPLPTSEHCTVRPDLTRKTARSVEIGTAGRPHRPARRAGPAPPSGLRPEGHDLAGRERRVPDSELWSRFGAGVKAQDPDALKRARLEEHLEYYRRVLADFRAYFNPS